MVIDPKLLRDFAKAWNALVAALGLKSLQITPQADGDLDSADPTGVGGVLVAPSVPVLGTPVATGTTTIDVPLSVASTGPETPITYVLEISTSPASGFTEADSGDIFAGDGIASLTGLTQATLYYLRCKAVGADTAQSAYSTVVSVTTAATVADTEAPGMPGLPSISAITSSGATASWTAATDNVAVTGYDVLLGTGDGAGNPVGSGSVIDSPSGLSYTLAGLSDDQQYYIRVRAKDAAGNAGAYTSRVYFTTSAAPVTADYDVFDNFEAATLDQAVWKLNINGGANTKVDISTVTALSGTRSRRSIITRDSAADYRAETDVKPTFSEGVTHFNEDCWYGVAIFLPASFVNSAGRDILVQWHTFSWLESPQESGTSPVNCLQVRNGVWQLVRNWNVNKASTLSTRQIVTHTLMPVTLGVWTRWVFRNRWHWINGQTQVWKDDVEVFNLNAGNCANDTYAPYWKFGNYRVAFQSSAGEPGVSPRIVYHDNARCILNTTGDKYSAVRP